MTLPCDAPQDSLRTYARPAQAYSSNPAPRFSPLSAPKKSKSCKRWKYQMSPRMSRQLSSWPKSSVRTSYEQDSSASGEWGNDAVIPVPPPTPFHPLASPVEIDENIWNLCFGWQDSLGEKSTTQSRQHIGVLREVDCEWI